MAEIKIRGQAIEIDIESELREFDWLNERWTSDKFQAASPFRTDRRPSFFVNLETGGWADSGASDDYYAKGNIVKLLAYLRQEVEGQTEDYLLDKYGIRDDGGDVAYRNPRLTIARQYAPLPCNTVDVAISPYLTSRGISEDVQRLAGVGQGRYVGFTAIPWRRSDGEIMNVMYRSTRGKTFFYEQDAMPIGRLLWGVDMLRQTKADEVVVCESPIDAMSWMTAGISAVATGGASISKEQADTLKRTQVNTIVLGGDNDEAGASFNRKVKERMGTIYKYKTVDYGLYKDANEALMRAGVDFLRQTVKLDDLGPLRFPTFAII